MKKIISGVVMFAFTLLAPQIVQAQGTITYVSSLSQNSTGNVLVGSDSWMAVDFFTGSNAGGYSLNSIQLGIADASGNPNGFTAMLYTATGGPAVVPGSSLGTLDGSLNPAVGGIFTYTPASSLTLSPNTIFFIVLTAGTTIANGAYSWSESAYPPSINNWGMGNGIIESGNGISGWSPTPYLGIAQIAINATPIPEPGVLGLVGLGGLAFLWHRKKARAV
jgi:hypothetical protein